MARSTAENAVKIGTNLVGTTGFGGVALETASLEKGSTLLGITYGKLLGFDTTKKYKKCTYQLRNPL